jgi:glucose/mannose transport system substrate-binding protein
MLTIKAALAGALAFTAATTAALAEPKTNMLHQWDQGSDAAAIAKLGEMFTAAGGKWEQTSISGHTANTLAKLRADVVAGNAPPAVQLKGPEIAEWNATGMTANLDELANKEGWDKVVVPELLPVMKPTGDWVAAPMNIHRINWIWASTKAMEKAGIKDAQDLGGVQRRLRQGGRRAPHLPRPFQPGLDRRDHVRGRPLWNGP